MSRLTYHIHGGGRGIWGRIGSTSVLMSITVSMSNVNLGGVESMGGDSGLCSVDSGLSDSGLKAANSSSNSSIKK